MHHLAMAVCVGVVYVLCALSIAQLTLSRTQRPALIKRALLGVGLFVSTIVGCLLALDMAGAPVALAVALIMSVLSTILHVVLSKKWDTDEASQERMLSDLQQRIDALQRNLSVSTSLETLCAKAAKDFDLTRREEDMLVLLSKGLSYAEISESLFLSQNTVKTHIRSLYKKMGTSQRAHLKHKINEVNPQIDGSVLFNK